MQNGGDGEAYMVQYSKFLAWLTKKW
jgi:hypothetical protein